MKIKRLIHISGALFLFLLFGCEKMEDTYYEFVKDGEITYVAKADSIKVRSGYNRIELTWLNMSDPKVSGYTLFWNSDRDSLQNTIVNTDGIDSVKVMLTNMREDVHNFRIIQFDELGNSSIPATAVGRVYGDNYRASLLQRTFASIKRSGTDLVVNWSEADNTVVFVEVKYVDSLDGQVIKNVAGEVLADTLSNFPTGGSFEFRTAFMPDTTAIDIFYTDYSQYTESN